jgi:protocatechuate 3,4-dioxygenase alpha subunit
MPGQTPSQTVGPFFHYGLIREGGADLVADGHDGKIAIVGRVIDGDGQPVPDALVEIWQADAVGRYAHPDDLDHAAADRVFLGFGRSATQADGLFRFTTIRPGRVAGPGNSLQAPHIAIGIMARGMLKRLTTRLYFADAPENAEDPILALIPPERRGTLIAERDGDTWRFDIVLQGAAETVFLEC